MFGSSSRVSNQSTYCYLCGRGSRGGRREEGEELTPVVRSISPDSRRAVFKLSNQLYSAKLVDLPSIIESQKTLDGKQMFKAADISQVSSFPSTFPRLELTFISFRSLSDARRLEPHLGRVSGHRWRRRSREAQHRRLHLASWNHASVEACEEEEVQEEDQSKGSSFTLFFALFVEADLFPFMLQTIEIVEQEVERMLEQDQRADKVTYGSSRLSPSPSFFPFAFSRPDRLSSYFLSFRSPF